MHTLLPCAHSTGAEKKLESRFEVKAKQVALQVEFHTPSPHPKESLYQPITEGAAFLGHVVSWPPRADAGAHLDALALLRALCKQEGLAALCALYPQEAVGGVADSRRQHLVPKHGVDHRALAVARPADRKLAQSVVKTANREVAGSSPRI